MKENKRSRNVFLLLVLAIISLVTLVATYARYTGIAGEASGTAKVAKWSVSLTGIEDKVFKHTYAGNLIADAGTQKIIAPGVEGSFDVTVNNDGDVTAKVSKIEFKEVEGNAAIPMEYSIDEGATWKKGVTELNTAMITKLATDVTINPTESNKICTVKWRWAFSGGDDEADTVLGKDSTDAGADTRTEYTLEMSVTAEQATPTNP